MLVDDIRARLTDRLKSWGGDGKPLGPKSNEVKAALKSQALSEAFLDQFLNVRKDKPHDITVGRLEKLATALGLSLPWLVFGIGKPELALARDLHTPASSGDLVARHPRQTVARKSAAPPAKKSRR